MDWKSIVKQVAPVLGTALSGPMGGAAVKFIGDKLLGKSDASEGDIASMIETASPEKLLELKSIDNDFKVKMRELDVDVYKIDASDRASARELFKVDKRPQITLSALFVVGYFAILYFFVSGNVVLDASIKDTVLLLLGLITREVPTIMQFWFGSSSGSKDKTKPG